MWLSFCVHGFTYVLFEMILEFLTLNELLWNENTYIYFNKFLALKNA